MRHLQIQQIVGRATTSAPSPRPRRAAERRGVILVKVAILMPVLIGMLGLVLDGGLILAARRQAQNAADAAAQAAAMDKVRGQTDDTAMATANLFIQNYNGLATADLLSFGTTFNIPPASGAYIGDSNFVEVIVTQEVQTCFIQVLGVSSPVTVKARAVAGFQATAAGEGVMVLDPSAKPGLSTSGKNSSIRVNGCIIVNSEGGGVDEKGVAVVGLRTAASVGSGTIAGTLIAVVGGVDSPSGFKPYVTGQPSPLHCRQFGQPDPLKNLPVPVTGNGVDVGFNPTVPSRRGTVKVTTNSVTFSEDPENLNFENLNFTATGGEMLGGGLYIATAGQAIVYPGIYSNISIEGGNVILMPGIYVISPAKTSDGFKMTGGTVLGKGIMIYVTGSNYVAASGLPDTGDGENPPLATPDTTFGSVSINAAMQLSPIDNKLYTYNPLVSKDFDGMLFYQRRRNTSRVTLTGDSAAGGLTGTLYAKWAKFDISGQGDYDAQFIVGSIDVTGQGNVTILAGGEARGKANQIYLVE